MTEFFRRNKAPIIIVALLVVSLAAFLVSRSYSQRLNTQKLEGLTEYSTTRPAELEADGERTLLAEIEEGDYHLYYYPETEKVTLEHGEIVKELDWGWSVKLDIPTMAYYDIDDDGEKEALIRVVSQSVTDDVSTAKTHNIYNILVAKEIDNDGTPDLAFFMADADTWRDPFKEAIKIEITQLNDSKKFIQVAMNNADRSIAYNADGTTDNRYTFYAAALRDDKNLYYTLNNWSLNNGIYNFDEENQSVVLDIGVIVQYNEDDFKEYIGNINCKMSLVEGKFKIVHNSITFIPLDNKIVTDPRDGSLNDWSIRIVNTGAAPTSGNTDINWIENQFDMRKMEAINNISFAGFNSKISCVDTIDIDQSKIVMTAKQGFSFSQRVCQNGIFTVTIEEDDGSSIQIDNTCEVSTDAQGNSVLTLTFDKTYDRDALQTLRIKYGA